MNPKRRVALWVLRERLQAIQHYDDPNEAFDILLYGFYKHMHFPRHWRANVLRMGYMSTLVAHEFALYCGYPIDRNA